MGAAPVPDLWRAGGVRGSRTKSQPKRPKALEFFPAGADHGLSVNWTAGERSRSQRGQSLQRSVVSLAVVMLAFGAAAVALLCAQSAETQTKPYAMTVDNAQSARFYAPGAWKTSAYSS
jgi:hypothetical protein